MKGFGFSTRTMMLPKPLPERPAPAAADALPGDRLLAVLSGLVAETHPQTPRTVTLDSVIDRDLGLDSLARVELALRLQREFARVLPDAALAEARTPRDLLAALSRADEAPGPPLVAAPLPRESSAAVRLPETASTLVEALAWHAERHGERPHVLLYGDTATAGALSYTWLWEHARRVAAGLAACGLQPGDRVALMLPTGGEYLACFYGALVAGGVPVPIYPPARLAQIEEHLARHGGILASAGTGLLITVPEAQGVATRLRVAVPALQRVVSAADLLAHAPLAPGAVAAAQGSDLAFLQYTSGSTGDPKGVALSHANLLANIRAMGQAIGVDPARDVFVSWLPLYHDMGLIGAWLGSLYHAMPLVLLAPQAFLASPVRWLQALSTHRGTLSAAPNFAYELCARRLAEKDLAGLDLSAWRLAFNGAEPVSPATLAAFARRFAGCGFHADALAPVYGLAECSVGLAFPPPGRGPRLDRVRREPLARHGEALPAAADDADALVLPVCGRPLPGHALRVVDDSGCELPERRVGVLQFRGPSATIGYYRNPAATARLLRDGWLDSGDYAYLTEGEVVLTGRAKDVIIRAGRNLYPYELEQAVGELPGVRRGCVAVFAARASTDLTEKLVVLAEIREETTAQSPQSLQLRQRIAALAVDCLGLPPDDVVLAPPHAVLKTSSGKIRRAACRAAYEAGTLGLGERSRFVQGLRYAGGVAVARLRLLVRQCRAWAFAGRAWGALALLALPVAGLVLLLPAQGRRVVRGATRLGFRLAGLPLHARGLERLPARPHLLVVPHASYLDALVLTALLPVPPGYTFVAKQELATAPGLGWLLRRLGTLFVARDDLGQVAADVATQTAVLARGERLVVFAEGTFCRESGLRPFRMGAFVAAARAGVPVTVAALAGTREVLRDETWRPRRGTMRLTVGATLYCGGNDWAAAARLRDAARDALLRELDEPDLEA